MAPRTSRSPTITKGRASEPRRRLAWRVQNGAYPDARRAHTSGRDAA
jgi:hypothetical protein